MYTPSNCPFNETPSPEKDGTPISSSDTFNPTGENIQWNPFSTNREARPVSPAPPSPAKPSFPANGAFASPGACQRSPHWWRAGAQAQTPNQPKRVISCFSDEWVLINMGHVFPYSGKYHCLSGFRQWPY